MASPLSNLNNDFVATLKDMGVFVVDVETTGLDKSDRMYSAAHSSFNIDPNSPIETKGSFFGLKGTNLPRKNYKTEESYLSALETSLKNRHSSQSFGEKQLKNKSLRGYAEAIANNTTSSPTKFLEELEGKVSSNTKGSVIFSHNSNFENNTFNNLKGSSKAYDSVFERLEARNTLNASGIFATNPNLSTQTRVSDLKGLSQKAGEFYNNTLVSTVKTNDPSLIRKALGEYAAKNVEVVNEIHNQINATRLKAGQYTSVDTMHLSRALMSFGALNGDVSIGNLVAGDKVEHQAMAFLGEKEMHTAAGDADQQSRIAKKLLSELDEYKKDPNYKSKLLKDYDTYLTKNNAATQSFKSSLMNQVLSINDYKNSDSLMKTYDFFDKSLDRYSIASGDHEERKLFHTKLKQAIDENIRDNNKSLKEVRASLEQFADEFDIKGPRVSTKVKTSPAMTESLMEGLKNHKKIVAVAGLGLGVSLLAGGGEKGRDKKYNTYDELYNSQYYGTGFADWQERNGAHKVLY